MWDKFLPPTANESLKTYLDTHFGLHLYVLNHYGAQGITTAPVIEVFLTLSVNANLGEALPPFLNQNKIINKDKLQRETLLTSLLYALCLLILNAIPSMCKELKSKFQRENPFPQPNLLHLWHSKASSSLRL